MPTYPLGHAPSSATEIQAKDLNFIGHAVAADATATVPHITTFLPSSPQEKNNAISVSETTTIDGRTLTIGVWYFPEDIATATVGDLIHLPGASGAGLKTLSIAATDVILAPTTFDLDYTTIEGELIDTEVYSPGHNITFGVPTFPTGADDRAIRHRVFINANTVDIDIDFTASGWKKFGSSNDADTITIPAGANRTLEFTHSPASNLGYVRVIGAAIEGLTTYTSGLTAGFIFLPEEDPANNIFEMNGQTLVGGVANYPTLAAKWPGWVSGTNIVLPSWQGRAMMAKGALGITGAAGATYSDATSVNGLQGEVFTRNDGGDTGTGFLRDMLARQTIRSTNSFMGSVRVNWRSQDAETRPNAVGLVLCVIAGDLAVQTVDQPTPTAFHVTTTVGNQNGNGLRSNGVYRSNNAGPLNGSGFGNWTWRLKVTVIGDWISQHYFNDTGNVSFRDSFDGGATWSAWGF